ncbi:MAG: DNA mismatch repair endonuclease MutH [Polyangiaceae bacterium]
MTRAEPRSEAELLERARALSGLTFADAAAQVGVTVPADLRHHKGWTGNLVERLLGATAGSRDVPDFESLGVELKTLPLDRRGRPVESTFVCTVPLEEVAEMEWANSRVRRKLNRVLFVPVEGERPIPMVQRRFGEPLIWSPTVEQEQLLRFDWDTLAGLIGQGQVERITGHVGDVMQVRPKAPNAAARRYGLDEDGVRVERMPRGFYLRATFTESILRAHYRYE